MCAIQSLSLLCFLHIVVWMPLTDSIEFSPLWKAECHVHVVEGMARWLTAFVRSLQLRSVSATHMYPGMCMPTSILMGNLPGSVYTVIIITVFPQLIPRPRIFSCLDYFPRRWDCTREDLIEDTETPKKIFTGHLQSPGSQSDVWSGVMRLQSRDGFHDTECPYCSTSEMNAAKLTCKLVPYIRTHSFIYESNICFRFGWHVDICMCADQT